MRALTLDNAWVMRRILGIMEILSGLKVNFDKCSIMGVNVEDSKLHDMANILGYNLGSFPFSYLGIRVGSNHRHISKWNFIIQKIKNRLCKWGDKKFSFGGRITYHLRNGVKDSWKLRLSVNGIYSTKDTYDFFLQNDRTPYINGDVVKGFKLIWKSAAPQKVIAHAWRLLWGRLPKFA
ncbi:hypothetical protein ACS0TY_006962 [Phlomoides rotata]